MIKNTAIGITLALFSFLLANGSQSTSPFAIYIALAALALGWFLSYEQEKKAAHINELRNQHLGALNKLSELEGENTRAILQKQEDSLKSLGDLLNEIRGVKAAQKQMHETSSAEQKALMGDLADKLSFHLTAHSEMLAKNVNEALSNNTEIVRSYTEKQLQLNTKYNENNEVFHKVTVSFQEAIASYRQLSQEQKNDFDRVRDKLEAVIEQVSDNHQKSTQAMLTSISQVNTSISETMTQTGAYLKDVVGENRDAVNRVLENLIGLFKQSQEELTQKVEEHHVKLHDALTKTYNDVVEKQDETFNNTSTQIEDAIGDLRQAIDDTNEKTRELTSTIGKVLSDLSRDLEENMNDSAQKFERQITKLNTEVPKAIESLKDGLASIAPEFMDYQEEKQIIKRLEALCKM
jgi:hypothetical protein